MTRKKILSLIGWYGVAAIISAYALLNLGIFEVGDMWYQVLNLTGALGIILDSLSDKDYQPVVLNIFWAGIAVWGIIQGLLG